MNDITRPNQPNPTPASQPVQTNVHNPHVGKPIRRRRWLKVLGVVALAAVIIAGVYYFIDSRPKVIKIGAVTITQKDIDEQTAALQAYLDSDKNLSLGAKTSDVALNDLVENAAFQKEIKGLKDGAAIEQAVQDVVTKGQQSNTQATAAFKKMYQIRAENSAYRDKLTTTLLAQKGLLFVDVSYDAPVYANKSQADVKALRKQSTDLLTSKFLPLVQQKTAKEEIAKQADVDLVASQQTSFDNDEYYKRIVSRASYMPAYLADGKQFNDINRDIYFGVKIDNLQDTDDAIAKLQKVGDTTGVVALRNGNYSIIRLESRNSGAYNSWDDFLEQYKTKYVGKKFFDTKKTLTLLLNQVDNLQSDIALPRLIPAAQADASFCTDTGHLVTVAINVTDNTSGSAISIGGMGYTYSRSRVKCPSFGGVLSKSGNVPAAGLEFTDNCWEDAPSFSITGNPPPPAGYKWVSVNTTTGAWAGGSVNAVGRYLIFVAYTKEKLKPPGEVSCDLTASPSSVKKGETSTLTATPSPGAVIFGINGPGLNVLGAGPWTTPALTSNSTYTVIVAKGDKRANCSATIVVTDIPPVTVSCSLYSGGSPVAPGEQYQISSTVRAATIKSAQLIGRDEKGTVVTTDNSYDVGTFVGGVGYMRTLTLDFPAGPPQYIDYSLSFTDSTGATGGCQTRVTFISTNPQCVATVGYSVTGANSALVRLAFRNGNKQLSYPDNKVLYKVSWPAVSGKASPPGEADGGMYGTKNFLTGAPTAILPPGGYGETAFNLTVPYNELLTPASTYPDPTFTFRVEKANSDGSDLVCPQAPVADAYGPWLQSKRGNVMALGNAGIKGQAEGKNGSRPASATDKEAQYVVMGYVVNKFCSTKGYGLGGGCSYTGYHANIDRDVFGTANDPVIKGISKALLQSISTGSACTARKPYLTTTSTDIAAQLEVAAAATNCQIIMTHEGSLTLSAASFNRGSGTIYIKGDVTISDNLDASYAAGYASPKQVSNLGIIATGDIVIAPGVERIDASLYAAGKVKTCVGYPSDACSKSLRIRGKLAAGGGFELGRNYFQVPNGPSSTPAELVVSSGLVDAFPPPGFVDLFSNTARGIRYLSTDSKPRF